MGERYGFWRRFWTAGYLRAGLEPCASAFLQRSAPPMMPYQRLTRVALAVLVGFCFAGEASAQAALQRIQESGKLVVALFAEDVPPFFFTDETGELRGIDPEIASDIAEKLGVEIIFNRQADTFDGLISEVAEGRADIAVSLLSNTLERATRVSFSRSYVSVRQFLLINRLELSKLIARSGDANFSIPETLNSEAARIGVLTGTSYVGFLRDDFPLAQGVEFDSWSEMLGAVKSGNLVGLMYDEIEVGNWRLADPAGTLELRAFHLTGHPDTIAIAVPHEDADLRHWIDLYLDKIEGTGVLAALLDRHLYSSDRLLTNE
jgi:polar amino acid transport system substrate-binding protein